MVSLNHRFSRTPLREAPDDRNTLVWCRGPPPPSTPRAHPDRELTQDLSLHPTTCCVPGHQLQPFVKNHSFDTAHILKAAPLWSRPRCRKTPNPPRERNASANAEAPTPPPPRPLYLRSAPSPDGARTTNRAPGNSQASPHDCTNSSPNGTPPRDAVPMRRGTSLKHWQCHTPLHRSRLTFQDTTPPIVHSRMRDYYTYGPCCIPLTVL